MLRKVEMIYLKVSDVYYPTTLVSDADNALIPAISTVFPHTHHLLCIWHVQKDVAAYMKKEIHEIESRLSSSQRAELVAKIETDWNKVLYASTEKKYETC